jgi:hypothetical protein
MMPPAAPMPLWFRRAKEQAEAGARAPDADTQRLAIDTDPIEARIIDEALRISGRTGKMDQRSRDGQAAQPLHGGRH